MKRNQKSLHEDAQVWISNPEAQKDMLYVKRLG